VIKSEKEDVVSSLRQSLEEASIVVVTRQSGLTVAEVSDLRSKMREGGAHYKVVKNTLSKIAVTNTPNACITDFLTGPTAIAFSTDPVAAAKIVDTFANSNKKLEIIGGSLDGKLLDTNAVKALASLPSLNELRGKLVGLISAPATKVAQVLQAPAGQLARVFSAYGNQG
jgi:large subunit ribosomal protein L10